MYASWEGQGKGEKNYSKYPFDILSSTFFYLHYFSCNSTNSIRALTDGAFRWVIC